MSSQADVGERLRRAGGPEPDAERALDDVLGRVRRRDRRRFELTIMAVAVLLVAASTWLVTGRGSDDSSVLAGEPPSTSDRSRSDGSLVLTELWTADGLGMGGSFVPSGGQLVVMTRDAIVVAEGFGSGAAERPD